MVIFRWHGDILYQNRNSVCAGNHGTPLPISCWSCSAVPPTIRRQKKEAAWPGLACWWGEGELERPVLARATNPAPANKQAPKAAHSAPVWETVQGYHATAYGYPHACQATATCENTTGNGRRIFQLYGRRHLSARRRQFSFYISKRYPVFLFCTTSRYYLYLSILCAFFSCRTTLL